MDPSFDDDRNDSIYANKETEELINVNELLKNRTIDELLKEDRDAIKHKESHLQWYHGRIAREAAEDVLRNGLAQLDNVEGLFLVRESSFSSTSFVLSLTCKGTFFHFQIHEVKPSHFSIDDGPPIQGLDKLVTYYQEHAQFLPTLLTKHCKCRPPPDKYRYNGTTNLLHRAVLQNDPHIVKLILNSKYRPNLDAKTSWGTTALHDACNYGFEDVVDLLIRKGADVNCLDRYCLTPLHRCCSANKAGIIALLIQEGGANINARTPKTGWVPLHQAAFKGHLDCVKILLDFHSPYYPRADDGTTPMDLAENYDHPDCFQELENFEPPKIGTSKKDWFHPELDRDGSQRLLELKGLKEGLFLVRKRKKNPDWYVLTLCHEQKIFNYEIRTKHYRDRLMYYIDDGPYYKTIEHVIQYYCHHANGLPCRIFVSVNTAKELVEVPIEDDYSNLLDRNHMQSCLKPGTVVSPDLPPRPNSLEIYSAPDEEPPVDIPKSPSKKNPPAPPNHPPPRTQASMTRAVPSAPTLPAAPPVEVVLTRIDRKQLTLGKEIGQGEFGSVLKGVYKKMNGRKKEKIDVAIKLFHKTAINNQDEFLKEAKTMQVLQNDYIVNFLGISETESHELLLVEEYISMGSMLDYLIDYKKSIQVVDLYLWASQIAYGMMYLEQKKMVHRDLAARNILLQAKNKAKISDFGLSRAVGSNDYYKATTGGRWPIKWYAPECVNYGQFSHASDVWSFGVTLWEMFTYGEPPYGDMKGIEVIKFIEDGKRLALPPGCPNVVYEQMLKCWNSEAKLRPTFNQLNHHFESHDIYCSVQSLVQRNK